MKAPPVKAAVAPPREALMRYLEALLREAGVGEEEAPAPPRPEPAETHRVAEEAPAPSPAWAESDFQGLGFSAGGLKLAAPLTRLFGIVPWREGELTPLPGHAPWFLGLLPHRGRQVKVVDLARLVLPQGRSPADLAPAAQRASHVLLVDEGRWGLAVDRLGAVLHLAPEDVRWRSLRTRRRWLAGTVIRHMCALLDVDALVAELAQS